ncbi:MAG: hypothetical protein SchgKO_04020 [Schleiferiaceae bacterium]
MMQTTLQLLESKTHLYDQLPGLARPVEALRRLLHEIGEVDSFFILPPMSEENTFHKNLRNKKAHIYRIQRRNLFKMARIVLTKTIDVEINSVRNQFPVDYFTYSMCRRLNDPNFPHLGRMKWEMKSPSNLLVRTPQPFVLKLKNIAS